MPKTKLFLAKQKNMVAVALSLLALAAGTYLLIIIKRDGLGSMYSVLGWAIVLGALVSIGFGGYKAIKNNGCKSKCEQSACDKNTKDCHGKAAGACAMGGTDNKMACPHMQQGTTCAMGCKVTGDSCEMDQAACEKMMGKEGCAKMMAERGRCIMSLEECSKMSGGACGKTCSPEAGKTCCKSGEEKKM